MAVKELSFMRKANAHTRREIMEKKVAIKHKQLVDGLSQFDDFESKLDEAILHPDFRLCDPETVKEYREILVREVLKARGQ